MRNKTGKAVLLVLTAVILVGGGLFIGRLWPQWFGKPPVTAKLDESAEAYTGKKETYTGEKNTDTIDIPGFDSMNLQADTKEQRVNLYNPEQNTCYFKISIYLKDGTQLWESELIEPGQAIYELTLNQTLSTGAYEACTLKYECFTMDDWQKPLNGSEVKFTMNVLS